MSWSLNYATDLMKKLYAYCFIVFGMIYSLPAQISFSFVKKDVACNNSKLGKIEVSVVSINPPYEYLWNTGDTTSFITDLSSGTYTLVISDSTGNDTTVFFFVAVTVCGMAPPLVFTPNDDAINDTWTIANSEFFPEAYIIVFNRLGQKVYEHHGTYEPWDGRDLLGIPLPVASYFYVLYEKESDEETIVKGSVSVIK